MAAVALGFLDKAPQDKQPRQTQQLLQPLVVLVALMGILAPTGHFLMFVMRQQNMVNMELVGIL
jgi:hypothetical protein